MSEPDARPLGGQLLHGSALTLASSLVSRGLAVVQSVVVARALDPQQIGVFAIVTYVLGLVAAFADLGLPTAAAKLLSEARGGRGPLRPVVTTLAVAMLGVAGLAGLVLLAAAAPLAALYAQPALGGLFRLGALLLALSLLGALAAGMLQGLGRITRLAVAGVVKGLVALAGIVLLVRPLGLAGVLVASIVAELGMWLFVAGPLGRAVASPQDGAAPARAGAVLRHGVHVAVPVFLAGLLVWGSALFVRSYAAAALGWADVGYFQLADALARVLVILPAAVAVPLVPLVSESTAAGTAGAAELTRLSLRGPLLAPGLGAQGAQPADLGRLFGALGDRVLPSSSRELLAQGPDPARLRAAAARLAGACAAALGRAR